MREHTRSLRPGIPEPVLAQFASRGLLDTRPDDVLQLLNEGTVSTNMYVRRLHNYALMLGWLPWPILNYRQWPSRKYKQKRDITWGEYRLLVDTEKEPEWRAFLKLAWHVGAAQIDLVSLCVENIDRHTKTITYFRRKTSKPCVCASAMKWRRPSAACRQVVRFSETLRTFVGGSRCAIFGSREAAWNQKAQ